MSCQACSLVTDCDAALNVTVLTDYRQEHTWEPLSHDFLVMLQAAVEALMHCTSIPTLAEALHEPVSYLCFIPELRHVIKVVIFLLCSILFSPFLCPHIHIFLGFYIINVWKYIFSYETRITLINTESCLRSVSRKLFSLVSLCYSC